MNQALKKIGFPTTVSLMLLFGCMSEAPSPTGVAKTLPRNSNTSDPGKPNYVDPNSSPEFQLLVSQKVAQNRDEIRSRVASSTPTNNVTAKSATVYYYGVLNPNPSYSCPDSAEIYMDDEDTYNGSSLEYSGPNDGTTYTAVNSTGGARTLNGISQPTVSGNIATGTKFRICTKSTTGALYPAQVDYAVFRMGDECPPNSYPFGRYFHNESSSGPNNNWYEGNIGAQWTEGYYSATALEFCFVPKSTGSTGAFWQNLGSPYLMGVFAYPWEDAITGTEAQKSYCRYHGIVQTDDEDDYNGNSWYYGAGMTQDYINRVQAFMSGGSNTQLFFTWCWPTPVGL